MELKRFLVRRAVLSLVLHNGLLCLFAGMNLPLYETCGEGLYTARIVLLPQRFPPAPVTFLPAAFLPASAVMSEPGVDVGSCPGQSQSEEQRLASRRRAETNSVMEASLFGRMDYLATKTLSGEEVDLYKQLKGSQLRHFLLQLFTECNENISQAMQLYVQRFRASAPIV